MRQIILGVPRSGKTILADTVASDFNVTVIHTDDLIDEISWHERAPYIAGLFLREPSWVVEGCDAVRGVRKFIEMFPDLKPADKIVWLDSPREELTPRQAGFAKGLRKIFREIQPHLAHLGVKVEIIL